MDITTPSDIKLLEDKGFQLEGVIGDGCYSKVFKAFHIRRGSKTPVVLACKVIDTASAAKDYKNKFLPRELDILVRVNHPHIIPVTSIFQRQTKYFIFMRLGDNGDLYDFVSKNGRVPEKQSRLWTRQIISAINYIHALNIAHRDLKCENILITSNFNVKVTDFGFARTVFRRGTDILSETYCGTLSYAAPEILKGIPYYPKMADMWSMGVILYTMLNQALPFKENTVKELYEKQVKKQWRFRSCVVNDLSAECKDQVTQLMEPEAKARPTAAKVFSGTWISMDQRIAKLTHVEETLLKKAIAIEKRFKPDDDTSHTNHTLDTISITSATTRNRPGLNTLKSTATISSMKESVPHFSDYR
ncbi:testis-specific serine/threonine-protein kinase 3-like [Leguminivora glycinivorella]|uniref:testis-specific serine/threonine-protein kinase 3-like n=1 Tax=Leguminivora glycinivorella TaxID=1035111 RepID=UPI00200E63B6|nr:testis-specific serine/threonine-protein kinase 3-like [Leguminivora glycinivorella]